MHEVQTAGPGMSSPVQDGTLVSALTHGEAMAMSAEELRRFLVLIETLSDEDWNRQTTCSLWTVKDIVAHQAPHVSSFTTLANFVAQVNPALLRP